MFKDKALGKCCRNLEALSLSPRCRRYFDHALTRLVAFAVDVRLEYNALSGPLPDDVHKLHALGRSTNFIGVWTWIAIAQN